MHALLDELVHLFRTAKNTGQSTTDFLHKYSNQIGQRAMAADLPLEFGGAVGGLREVATMFNFTVATKSDSF